MKPKNIGFSQRQAQQLAKGFNQKIVADCEAYAQKEDHWLPYPNARGTYQWIVIIQKRSNK